MRNRVVALLALVVVAVAGVVLYREYAPPPAQVADPTADSGPFALVDAAERALDGSPALSLTFSQPLDPRKS